MEEEAKEMEDIKEPGPLNQWDQCTHELTETEAALTKDLHRSAPDRVLELKRVDTRPLS